MAFYLDEEEKEQGSGQGFTPGGQSSDLGSGGGTGVGGASGQPSNKPDNPGNFVGLKTYLDANKSQSQKLGDNVSGQVSGSINNAQTGINNLNSQFDQSAKSGLINDFDNAGTQAQNISNNASTGTKQNLPKQADVTRFGEIANAQYKGPRGVEELEGYDPVLQSISEAQKLSGLAGTEEGKIGLVKNAANPQSKYSEGQAKLDSYLLGGDENKQKLESARSGFQNINPLFDTTKTNAKTQASLYDKQTNDLKNNARNLLKNTSMAKATSVQSGLDATKKQIDKDNQTARNLKKALYDPSDGASMELTPEMMSMLGVTENQRLYGALNNADYVGAENVYDANRSISVDDQARMAALAGLSGTFGGGFSNPYTMGEFAGTQKSDLPYAGTKDKLQSEIKRREGIYNKAHEDKEYMQLVNDSKMFDPGTKFKDEKAATVDDYIKLAGRHKWMSDNNAGKNTTFAKQRSQGFQKLLDALSGWKGKYGFNDTVKLNQKPL